MKALERGGVTAEPLRDATDLLSWYRPSEAFAFLRHGRGVVANGVYVQVTVLPVRIRSCERRRSRRRRSNAWAARRKTRHRWWSARSRSTAGRRRPW